MAANLLTDLAIKRALREATNTATQTTLVDGEGLSIIIKPDGKGWWRLRYWLHGRENRLSLGVYPEVPLRLARERRDDARKLIAAGTDPSAQRKADKIVREQRREVDRAVRRGEALPGSFEIAARLWLDKQRRVWSAGHYEKVKSLLERDLFPFIGARPLADIEPPELLQVLRRVEARGAVETAYRGLGYSSEVFRYGVREGLCKSDPTRDLRGAFVLPQAKHRAAILDPLELGGLLRSIDDYIGGPVVRAALALGPLTFVRPGELRKAEWREVDLDAATWTIPAQRMKGRLKAKQSGKAHLVPLSRQAVKVLRDLQPITGAGGAPRFVFPHPLTKERCMSENAVLSALRRMGYTQDQMTGHGWRAIARTLIVERLGVDEAVVEAQLAHKPAGPLGRAYNRAEFERQRIVMMQKWADYLDELRESKPKRKRRVVD